MASLALSATAFAATNNNGFHRGIGRGGMIRPGVVGTVASVNGTTLTVTSKGWPMMRGNNAAPTPAPVIYTVDASNATVTKNGTTSSVSNIAVGDTVMIQGTVSGTSVTATVIRDGMPAKGQNENGKKPMPAFQGNGQPVVAGKVASVSGTTITITNSSNVTYTIDASSAKFVKGGTTNPTISNVSVGDSVVVQGTVNGTSVAAATVIDQSAPVVKNTSNTNAGTHPGFLGSIRNFFGHLFGF